MINTVKTDGQRMIHENFKVLDQRMFTLAKNFQIQLAITLFCTIIIAQAIWLLIRRAFNKLESSRPRYIIQDTLTAHKYGLATEEKIDSLKTQEKTKYEGTQLSENRLDIPEPPSVEHLRQLHQEIKRQKEEKNPPQTPPLAPPKPPKKPRKSLFKRLFKKKNKTIIVDIPPPTNPWE